MSPPKIRRLAWASRPGDTLTDSTSGGVILVSLPVKPSVFPQTFRVSWSFQAFRVSKNDT